MAAAAAVVKGLPEDLVNEAAELFTVILATATNKQRSAGYMCDSGKDMNPHELLDAFSPQLAALGNRIFAQVTLAKYSRNQEDFLKRVSEKTIDTAARTQPCWRCGEVWSERKPNCGCVKCKNNPKYYGSDLGAGTNYEPPTCLVYAASFKVFIHAAIRTLMYVPAVRAVRQGVQAQRPGRCGGGRGRNRAVFGAAAAAEEE